MTEISLNFLKAGIVIVFLLAIDFIFEYLLTKKVKHKTKSIKLRVMLRYALFFCFLFFMAKIWVEGFGYLLTLVGFIAAALTITQKEYLMNFFGWLIIMWRDLFSEGDYIEISHYRGYVESIGPLYFSLAQASELTWGARTGKEIKLPNSLIAMNPILKYNNEMTFVEGRLSFIFQFKSSLAKIQQLAEFLEREINVRLGHLYGHSDPDNTGFKDSLFQPQTTVKVFQDKPSGIKLDIKYLSLKQDQKIIDGPITALAIKAVAAESELEFSVAM